MDVRTVRMYAPCFLLDIEAMQTWLEDLSMEGYLLKGSTGLRGQFEFYRIEPLRTRYRLTPVSDSMEEWNLRPNEEYVSITEAYGWEHVCSSTRFHIFRTYDEEAREIHTDPALQTQAIRQLGQRVLMTALAWLALPLTYLLILFAFGGVNSFWLNLILENRGIHITIGYFVLLALARATVELVRIFGLYQRMKRGEPMVNRKEWRKNASVYRSVHRAIPTLLLVFVVVMTMSRAAYRDHAAYQELPPVGTELPFLSVADMAQDSTVQSAQRMEDVNYMRHWSHPLSPVNYDWAEIVEVVGADGTEGLVSIDVRYHEAKYDWLAESLTREYLAKADGVEMDTYPQTNADMAWFYYNEYGKPAAVLRYGKTVVGVEFPRADLEDPVLQFEYWIERLDGYLTGT